MLDSTSNATSSKVAKATAQSEDRDVNQGEPSPPKGRADYRSLVAQFIDPVIIVNRIGRICFMNPAAHQWLKNGLADRLETYLATRRGKRTRSSVRFTLDDGKQITLEATRRKIEWIGKPVTLVALHDISRHVRATERAHSMQLHKLSLLQEVPVATYVLALGDDSIPPYLSHQFEEMLGYSRDSWKANPELWRQFIHEEDYERVIQELADAIKNDEPFAAEYRMVAKNGCSVWVREEARVLKEKGADGSFLAGVLTDITDKTWTEQQLTSVQRELEGIEERNAQELAETKEHIQRELAETKETVNRVTEECTELENQLSERAAEVTRARAELEEKARGCEKLEKEKKSTLLELNAARQNGEKWKAKAKSLKTQLSELSAEVTTVRTQLEQNTSAFEKAKKENKYLQMELDAAKQSAQALKAKNEDIEKQLSEGSAEVARIESQLQDQKRDREQAQKKSEELRQQLAAAKASGEKLLARRNDMEKWLRARAEELEKAAIELREVMD